jgi:hypothetical protein
VVLPDFLAKPSFHVIYLINRRMEGARSAPIRRAIRPVDDERRRAYDRLLDSALAGHGMEYALPYPKADFLNYVCDWRGLVAHGSIEKDLEVLQPLRKTHDTSEFGERQQIFCSPDAMWAMWFAILDKSRIQQTRNGSVRVGQGRGRVKYYHFEIPAAVREDPPFTQGMIYIANAADFPDHRPYPILDLFNAEVEEWGSTQPVRPLAKLPVSPQDFPYLDRVQFSL